MRWAHYPFENVVDEGSPNTYFSGGAMAIPLNGTDPTINPTHRMINNAQHEVIRCYLELSAHYQANPKTCSPTPFAR